MTTTLWSFCESWAFHWLCQHVHIYMGHIKLESPSWEAKENVATDCWIWPASTQHWPLLSLVTSSRLLWVETYFGDSYAPANDTESRFCYMVLTDHHWTVCSVHYKYNCNVISVYVFVFLYPSCYLCMCDRDLNGNRLRRIKGLTFQGLSNVLSLRLRRNLLTELMDGAFYGLTNIQNMYVIHIDIYFSFVSCAGCYFC